MSPKSTGGLGASTPRILAASLVGTSVEFYDFYIYATAASLVFGSLFFPAASPSVQLLASFATLSVAFIARPVGAVVFGHFGDRIGRKTTLVASLLLMGGSTVVIGLLPTYATIGWPAPALLCLLRFGQGFGLGGEWGGAVLLAVENATPSHRARFGMFPQLGAPIGFIAANSVFLALSTVLSPEQFISWGWRLPFLSSAVLVLVGLWVRLKLTETPAFLAALAEAPPPAVPVAEVVRRFPKQVIGGTFSVVAIYAIFYLVTAFALGYGTTSLGYSRESFLIVQLAAIPFLAIGIVWSGYWSDATTPRGVNMIGCALMIPAGLLLAPMLGSGSLVVIWAFFSLALLLMGLAYGPVGAFIPSLFPARVRYTGASMALNVGGIIGGALTPVLAQTLASRGGLAPVGLYLSTTALISLIALFQLGRSAGINPRIPSPQSPS